MEAIESYVGIPWRWRGYDRGGTFCWGLVWMVQREVFGRADFPRLPHSVAADDGASRWAFAELDPQPVALNAARAGDLLHMRGSFREAEAADLHIGVFADIGRVLHTEKATGSLIERVNSKRFQWRPIQAYRLK